MKEKSRKTVMLFRGFLAGTCRKNSRAFFYRLSALRGNIRGCLDEDGVDKKALYEGEIVSSAAFSIPKTRGNLC